MNEIKKREDSLFERISVLIEEARKRVKTAIDTTMVYTYYGIGHYIVEDEQQGEQRAKYGQTVLKKLSVRLTDKYGEGWSVENLKLCRRFYVIYSNSINSVYPIDLTKAKQSIANSPENDCQISETQYRESKDKQSFSLSWSHYLVLMRIKNEEERHFYEIECQRQDWSVRQLKREYRTSLYERIALSRDKKDLKAEELSHQDLGQMQMYVNYYDRHVKEVFEKPTIGILLCKDKDNALVELTLPKDANIYASSYELCRPYYRQN